MLTEVLDRSMANAAGQASLVLQGCCVLPLGLESLRGACAGRRTTVAPMSAAALAIRFTTAAPSTCNTISITATRKATVSIGLQHSIHRPPRGGPNCIAMWKWALTHSTQSHTPLHVILRAPSIDTAIGLMNTCSYRVRRGRRGRLWSRHRRGRLWSRHRRGHGCGRRRLWSRHWLWSRRRRGGLRSRPCLAHVILARAATELIRHTVLACAPAVPWMIAGSTTRSFAWGTMSEPTTPTLVDLLAAMLPIAELLALTLAV